MTKLIIQQDGGMLHLIKAKGMQKKAVYSIQRGVEPEIIYTHKVTPLLITLGSALLYGGTIAGQNQYVVKRVGVVAEFEASFSVNELILQV